MTYDDAGWHYDSVIEQGLPLGQAATHIGMFFAWLAHRNMVDPDFTDITPLIARTMTPGQFLTARCAGEINSSMLTPRAAAFTEAAYRNYLNSYGDLPYIAKFDGTYVVPDTWETYDAVAPLIDEIKLAWDQR
ncbi:hypothetical protein ABQE48_13825 [Mycolicibacterium thermoresistibile]